MSSGPSFSTLYCEICREVVTGSMLKHSLENHIESFVGDVPVGSRSEPEPLTKEFIDSLGRELIAKQKEIDSLTAKLQWEFERHEQVRKQYLEDSAGKSKGMGTLARRAISLKSQLQRLLPIVETLAQVCPSHGPHWAADASVATFIGCPVYRRRDDKERCLPCEARACLLELEATSGTQKR